VTVEFNPVVQGGMTLLDYFASQALSGMLPHANTYVDHPKLGDMARYAFSIAEAMLEESNRRLRPSMKENK